MPREVYLINWKKQKNHIEIFDDLRVFSASYPRYNFAVISKALSYGISVFEDDDVRIEKKTVVVHPKPDFPPMFFWDFNYDRINWEQSATTVIQRMLERGTDQHWRELIRFYGNAAITQALQKTITYLPDECIDEVSLYFKIDKEDMLCYKRKQSQPTHWL